MATTKTSTKPTVTETPEEKPVPREKLFISEGVRNDILLYGSTIDPLTGRTLTKADI